MRLRGRRLAAAAGILAAAVALAVASLSHRGARTQEPWPRSLLDEVVAAGAPGALLLIRDGSETSRVAAGLASLESGARMRPGDRFRVGSVTKSFVAALVLELAAERKLRLEDNVERWLPGLVPSGGTIKIRDLLRHTSGLADYVQDPAVFAPYASDPTYSWEPRRLAALAVSRPPSAEPPGMSFVYASTNYLLLGLIVEEATGKGLRSELEERIFGPLDLRRTSFEPLPVEGPHVHGHRPPSHGGVVTGPPVDSDGRAVSWSWSAGAIVSTADDLARFWRALLGGRVLPRGMMRELRTLVPAGPNRYGPGVAVFPTPCGSAWGHTGNIDGTITSVWSTREGTRQVVLAANVYPLSPELERAFRHAQVAAFCGP